MIPDLDIGCTAAAMVKRYLRQQLVGAPRGFQFARVAGGSGFAAPSPTS